MPAKPTKKVAKTVAAKVIMAKAGTKAGGAKAKTAVAKSVPEKKALKKEAKKAAAPVETPAAASVAPISVETAKKALAKEKGVKEGKVRVDAGAQGPLAQKWSALFKKSEAIESKPYNMKATYAEKTAIVHKVLGWGYILANRNDRLEVLFKDGIKYLISNYK
jgi:hypothetical protein